MTRLLLVVLGWLLATAVFADGAPAADASALNGPARQILVLLNLPARHFRVDGNYAGGYGDAAGRSARRRVAARLAREHGLTPLTDWPMPVIGVDCYVMAVPTTERPDQAVQALSNDARVAWAQTMNVYSAHRDPQYTLYEQQPAAREWQLAALHRVATGLGSRVAVIDSGVQTDHPDLAGGVEISENFVSDRPNAAEAHGTGVAGIIAARSDNRVGIVGIAPQAQLMALRACWQTASATSCTSLSLAKALDFAIRRDAQVINLSLGGPPDRLLGQLIDVALARGITVVAAAEPAVAGGGFPASHRGVVAVGEEADVGTALGAIMAPGRDVPTTAPGSRWSVVSGASYAAAHVSGLFALLRQLQPSGTGAASAAALVLRPDGRINVCATVRRAAPASASCNCDCPLGPTVVPLAQR